MNEKIKELAEQAGLRFTQLMSNPMVPVVDCKETDLEKFVQLIVEECAQEFDNTYMEGGKTMGAYLREKFGVEE